MDKTKNMILTVLSTSLLLNFVVHKVWYIEEDKTPLSKVPSNTPKL